MGLSLEKIFKVMWKNIVILGVSAVVCAVAAFLVTELAISKTYVSRISFTVISTASDTNIANPSYLNSNLNYTRSIVRSKVEMLRTTDYFEMVAAQLNSDIDELIAQNPDQAQVLEASKKTAAQINAALTFSIIEETELFSIRVTTHSSGESKMIADAIEKTANARLTQLAMPENALAGETPVADTVRCYETPLPGVLSGPNVAMNTITGFLVGFVLSFLVVFIINVTDTRVKNIADLNEKFSNVPVLGVVPSFKTAKK